MENLVNKIQIKQLELNIYFPKIKNIFFYMERYIIRKDFLVWSEKKRLALIDCIAEIRSYLKSDKSNKLDLVNESINNCTNKCKELNDSLNDSVGDIDIGMLPIKYSGEQELIDLFRTILSDIE